MRLRSVLGSSCQRLVASVFDVTTGCPYSALGVSVMDRRLLPYAAVVECPDLRGLHNDVKATDYRYDTCRSGASRPLFSQASEHGVLSHSVARKESLAYSSTTAGAPVASDVSSPLEEETFHDLADDFLHLLQEKLEVYGEDLNVDGFDSDYASGVLTLRLGSKGTYVINKQTPNRQIWLSSPVSGPGRFDWSKSKSSWIYQRENVELVSLLEKELSALLGSSVRIRPS